MVLRRHSKNSETIDVSEHQIEHHIHHHLHQNNEALKNYQVDDTKNTAKKKELTLTDKITMLLAETMGTGLLVFFGCMGCINWFDMPGKLIKFFCGLPIQASLNFGLTVMFVVNIFGNVSYAIINPAVVITAVVNKLIDIKMGFMYIIAEVIGAILGYGALFALTPTKYFQSPPGQDGLCITNLHPSITIVQGFFIEFIITSVLVFLVCSFWDPRNKDKGDSATIKLGLTVAALCFAAAPATVASMNPARSIGPAVWNNEWENHWLYWTATMSGSLCSSVFYRLVFWKDPEAESTEL